MKYFLKIVLVVTFTLDFNESRAGTLFDSLNSAYLNNPKLNAERASLRASKEEKRAEVGEFLPSVTISGYVGEQDNTGDSSSNFNMVFKWRLLQEKKLRKKLRFKKKIMSYNEIKRFIMFYQRITLQMIKDLSKSASIVMSLNKNHEIKKVLFK